MIETALFQYLSAHVGLTALVGSRIYPMQAPAGAAKPCLVYTLISIDRKQSHDGYSGVQVIRMQISCFAAAWETDGTTVGVKAVAAQVIAAMEAWEGATDIQAVFPAGEQDLFEEETQLYHTPLDFEIWYGGN